MGRAYSVDLRERVVASFDREGMTDQEAAALFRIGEATVRRWKRLKRETGALRRRPGGGGNPPRIAPEQYDVVLDNVGAHKTADVRRLIRAAGACVLYLPPYSPDLNPIELAWSKLKALLREFGARTRDALDDAIHRAMDLIDAADAAAWFTLCWA